MNSGITFTPCLKKKYSSDKVGIINIRVTENRKSQYFSLKETIREQFWNKKRCEVKNNYEDVTRLTNLIEERIKELKSVYGVSQDIKELKKNEKISLLTFFKNHLDFLINRNKVGTFKSYQTSYLQLEKFIFSKGKSDILFSDLDIQFITDFETFLLLCMKRLFEKI